MEWPGWQRGVLGVCAFLGWGSVSLPALAQDDFYAPPSNAPPAKPEDDSEDDDVDQANAGRAEQAPGEEEARRKARQKAKEAKASEAEVPGDGSAKRKGPRLSLAFRSGYALSMGEVVAGNEISELVAGQVPFMVDLGVRWGHRQFIGFYFSYGLGILGDTVNDACVAAASNADVSCSASAIRIGLEYIWHARSTPKLDPWVGFGFGAEFLTVREHASLGSESAETSTTFGGPEFASVQFGLDYALAKAFALGPFLMFTVANYQNAAFDCVGNPCPQFVVSSEIPSPSAHFWFAFGVKATLSP